ncbi:MULTISPECIES: hypothetical protein [Streptomyces]|uniref:hypothetical protein n=1 Tax=Streptomyces TaxID=1883 RepID=UPI002FDC14C2
MLTRRRRFEESGPYWKQRSWQLSAGFLGLVVLVGGFVALTSDGDGARAAAASHGPLTDNSLQPDGRPKGCHTDDNTGNTLPPKVPNDISWHTLGISRVPVSASAGPTRTSGPVHWCYAHTPVGAVLAATVIPSQMSGSGWRTASRQQVVAGYGRDVFEFKRATVQDADNAAETGGAPVASYSGFSVTSYTSEAANVSLLIRGAQGYGTTSIQLRWEGGDWKIVPDGNGSLHTPVDIVQGDPHGYILWGGAR